MLCVECGNFDQSHSTICGNCGALFPDRATPPPGLNKNLRDLEIACSMVRNREISSGDFRGILSKMQNMFRKNLDDVEKMDIPADIREEMKEEFSTGTVGIKFYLEAINEMFAFLEDRQEVHLERGLVMARDANSRINQALRINFENYRILQETTEEFLATQSMV
ncbi:MAG: hypothetical protein LWY06_08230 [Firmicutes bacterium]|nr:hypothetical protein [Bacillota bacterium]